MLPQIIQLRADPSNNATSVPLENVTNLINALTNALPSTSNAGPDVVLEFVVLEG